MRPTRSVPCTNLTVTSGSEASSVVAQVCGHRFRSAPCSDTPRRGLEGRRRRPDSRLRLSFFSAADVGALGPRRPAPRSASLSPANFAPQTEAAFEKRPAQQPFGDPTCVRRAESEASRAAGVGSLAGGRWGRAPCEHLPRGATPDILAARARAGSWQGPRIWGSPAHAVAVECVQYGCWRPRVLLSPEDVLRPQSLSLESTKNAFV